MADDDEGQQIKLSDKFVVDADDIEWLDLYEPPFKDDAKPVQPVRGVPRPSPR